MNFIVVDNETNGFGPARNEPIQITAVRYDNGKALKVKYDRHFMPEMKFTKSARKVTG